LPQFPRLKVRPFNTEFVPADPASEMRALVAFDRIVFRASDRFPRDYWMETIPYWMRIDGVKVGCCAFQHHIDFREDLGQDNLSRKGSLYIATTGIHPRFQSLGLGTLMKCWQISYARSLGFHRIVTNVRARNAAIVALNEKFGFRTLRTTPGYYAGPRDATIVMEKSLRGAKDKAS
jgi:ribosomal protein S18 acetylase RimI-like enzyme